MRPRSKRPRNVCQPIQGQGPSQTFNEVIRRSLNNTVICHGTWKHVIMRTKLALTLARRGQVHPRRKWRASP